MLRLLAVLVVISPLAAADFQPDPRSVRREGAGYRYPQAGWIVLHLEGEPHERGLQHGKLLWREIEANVYSLAAQQSKADPKSAWDITRTMVSALFLRKFDQEFLEEMQGIADGAAGCGAKFHGRPVDLVDIVCLNVQMEYETLDNAVDATPTGLEGKRFPRLKTPGPAAADHCSAFAATGPATKDGRMVIGHITMSGLANALCTNVWLDIKPAKGNRIVMQGFPGAIWSGQDYYLNDAGIVLTETTIRQTRFNPEGIPLTNRCRKAMQYGKSIDDVVKILLEGNNGLYTNEWLIGNANTNEIAMFELGTSSHKLWRSSKLEWLMPGCEGFYWGCNNTKDLAVRLDTHASLNERPQDVSFRPSDRDKAWLKLYDKHRGNVDCEFGKLAFRTSPLAGKPSLDAKVTDSALAKELKSWALFGPPTGQLWLLTQREIDKYHEVRSLVPNDWTMLTTDSPKGNKQAVLADFGELPEFKDDPPTVPAWRGTLLPKSDADIWLTAGFAAYERIVALENALREQSNGKLTDADKTRIDRELHIHRMAYAAAKVLEPELRKLIHTGNGLPKVTPLEVELDRSRWHDEQKSLGVLRLAKLRSRDETAFEKHMEAYGAANAAKPVSAREFLEQVDIKKIVHSEIGLNLVELDAEPLKLQSHRPVSITGWMNDPENCVIIYGTLDDTAGNKAAALELQRAFRVKWTLINIPVRPDSEMNAKELAEKHVLLVGRPSTNKVTRKFEGSVPVKFHDGSIEFNDMTYGHERSAIIAAGVHNTKHSVVIIAGLSADATFHAASLLPNAPSCEILAIPRGTTPQPLVAKPAK